MAEFLRLFLNELLSSCWSGLAGPSFAT